MCQQNRFYVVFFSFYLISTIFDVSGMSAGDSGIRSNQWLLIKHHLLMETSTDSICMTTNILALTWDLVVCCSYSRHTSTKRYAICCFKIFIYPRIGFSALPLFSPICTFYLNIVESIQYLLFNSAQCIFVRPNALQCVTQWTFWNFNAWLARVHMRYTINRRTKKKLCKNKITFGQCSLLSDATMSRGYKRMQWILGMLAQSVAVVALNVSNRISSEITHESLCQLRSN